MSNTSSIVFIYVPCNVTHISTYIFTIFTHILYTHTLQGNHKERKPYKVYIQIIQNVIYGLYIPYTIQLRRYSLLNLKLKKIKPRKRNTQKS